MTWHNTEKHERLSWQSIKSAGAFGKWLSLESACVNIRICVQILGTTCKIWGQQYRSVTSALVEMEMGRSLELTGVGVGGQPAEADH